MNNDVHLYREIQQAKRTMKYSYSRWSMGEPQFEEQLWTEYQTAVERYNALVNEYKKRQESNKVVYLPWVAS